MWLAALPTAALPTGALTTAALTTVDAIALLAIGLMALRGLMKGFAWQAVRTVGLVGALWGATAWHEVVGRRLSATFSILPERFAPWLAWGLLLVILFLVAAYLAWVARGLVRGLRLGGIDRVLGVVSGAALGLVLSTAGLLAWGSFVSDERLREVLRDSATAPAMSRTVEVLEPFLPPDLRRRWQGVLDTLDEPVPSGG